MGNKIAKPAAAASNKEPHVVAKPSIKDEDNKKGAVQVIVPEYLAAAADDKTRITATTDADSAVSSISDPLAVSLSSSFLIASPYKKNPTCNFGNLLVTNWDGTKLYSDYVRDGLAQLGKDNTNVLMLYESPSSSSTETSFYNNGVFNYHDYPSFPWYYKSVLAPCRYSIMSGDAYPSYLRDAVPTGLVEHWQTTLPATAFRTPTFTPGIPENAAVYAYLPVEHLSLDHHVNIPHVHYHLAGKDALPLMTSRTTKLLGNMEDERPCVVKVTHAMGSKGIFVIRNDADQAACLQFMDESGHPTYVISEFVNIRRNVACHFFIHPGDSNRVDWFGSNENVLLPNGEWSTDSTIIMNEQEALKELQMPFVIDCVNYCRALGFWGFCGVDVLFDEHGQGYLVDVNPRVTGTCPALMIASLLQKEYGFAFALFRRNSSFAYRGSAAELLAQAAAYNDQHEGHSRIVLHSFFEKSTSKTLVNIGVYAHALDDCQVVLDQFAPAQGQVDAEDQE